MRRLRIGDEVVILSGNYKKRRGTIRALVGSDRALVTGLNMVKKHVKPNPQLNIDGGIEEREAPMHLSKLALIDPASDRHSRIGYRVENGKKIRYFKRSGDSISPAK